MMAIIKCCDIAFLHYGIVPDGWASVATSIPLTRPVHGSNYTIHCSVNIINGMNIRPVIQWHYPNGSVVENGSRTTIGSLGTRTLSNHGIQKTLSLTFFPVHSDDGGLYSCRAQVTVPWMTEQPHVQSASANVIVTSTFSYVVKHIVYLDLSFK